MKTKLLSLFLLLTTAAMSQELPARWDELTATDWKNALDKSSRTCILPIGILEKHGPHSPLGTDLIHVRDIAARVVKTEYAVTFPDYFYGQINEARQQPGTFALPSELILKLIEATCDEIARNGFTRIVILNGHGGNPEFIRFFMQSQLNKRKNYAVYFYTPQDDPAYEEKLNAMRKSPAQGDLHAGERETSTLLYLHPELMKMDRASSESGENQKRAALPPDVYTPVWWYAGYPNHYAGEGAKATKELGQLIVDHEVESFSKALKAIKADTRTLQLQEEYYKRVDDLNKK